MDKAIVGHFIEQQSYDKMFTLVTLDDTETVSEALRKFRGHKILSAPVRFQVQKQPQEGQIMAHGGQIPTYAPQNYKMLDLLDIALEFVDQNHSNTHHTDSNDNSHAECALLEKPIHTFCNTSKLNPFLALASDATVLEALRLLSVGVHRIIVIDQASDKPIGVVSQMDILRWITKHWEWIPEDIRRTPVGDLMNKKVTTVKLNSAVIDAFRQFATSRYSGAAIVDDNGVLIQNLSISDLRVLSPENTHILDYTVEKFLELIKKYPASKLPVVCTVNTPLETAIKTMVNEHVHRLFIVNENNQPIGVLSGTNIVQFLPK